jgi:hypothetical protein
MSTPTDEFADLKAEKAPDSEVTLKELPASVVAMAQASLDTGERRQAKCSDTAQAERLVANLSGAGRFTSPVCTVRPTISKNDATLVYWRAFIRAARGSKKAATSSE